MKIEWVLMNMRLSGSPVDEEKAAGIAAGEYVLTATLEEHLMVSRLLEALSLMENMSGMEEELSVNSLAKFYRVFSGREEAVFRMRTPVLFHLSYNPVLPQEIEDELGNLFRKLHSHPVNNGPEQAVYVHNEIIRIYPFDDCNELIARAAMEYELLYCGRKFCPLTLSESQYNSALMRYVNGRGDDTLLENLRLNLLMRESCEGDFTEF